MLLELHTVRLIKPVILEGFVHENVNGFHQRNILHHFQSHVDGRCRGGLVDTMVDRAYRLSSTEEAFAGECDGLRATF